MITEPARCSAVSESLEEPLPVTAPTAVAYLLIEDDGPWGREALLDSRLPPGFGAELSRLCRESGIKPLVIRSGEGRSPGSPRRIFAAWCAPDGPRLWADQVAAVEALLSWDWPAFGGDGTAPHPSLRALRQSLLLVCTHGRRDACCAERGRPVAAAARAAARTTPAVAAWEVSHLGGHRFAANVLVLPDGLAYGRVAAERIPGLIAAQADGRIDLDHYRGRTAWPPAAQAAEVVVRRTRGWDRVADLLSAEWAPASTAADDAGVEVRLQPGRAAQAERRTPVRAVVRERTLSGIRLSCRDAEPAPATAYEVHLS